VNSPRALVLAFLAAAATLAGASPRALIVCAPGYPGTTVEAQPAMDALARGASAAAGWQEGSLAAVYHEKEEAGLARLRGPDAALALVPLPFLVEHGVALALTPRLLAIGEGDGSGTWTLVAPKGKVGSASDLAGWEILSIAGYSPRFVVGVALSGFGRLPAGARIAFSPAILSALRRSARGEKVAVLLDASQSAALADLPFAAQLDRVHTSPPLPGTMLCTVGSRLTPAEIRALTTGLLGLSKRDGGPELLRTLRMKRFDAVDVAAIEALLGLAGEGQGSRP